MRILALYPFLPYPVVSGAALRGCAVLDVLVSRHQVTLASFAGHDDKPSELPSWTSYQHFAAPPLIAPRETSEELTPAARQLRSLAPQFFVPQGLRFFDSPAMWNGLASLDWSRFDAIHVRFAGMAPYALALKRAVPRLHLVIDLDDNPSLLLYRKLRNSQEKPRMFFWQLKELVRMFAFELRYLREFDSVWICSAIDHRRLSRRIGQDRVLIIENVVDTQTLSHVDRHHIDSAIIMIGDFNYPPNRDGAFFFVREVWPAIRSRRPQTQLWLVGKNGNPEMLSWNGKNGITVTGLVKDVKQYLARAMVSVAPLFVGTGTKLKILEALAAGVPVVTTTVGAEGIDVTHEADVLLADTAHDFAAACIRVIEEPTLRDALSRAGKHLIRKKYDISVMSDAVLRCYDNLTATKQH